MGEEHYTYTVIGYLYLLESESLSTTNGKLAQVLLKE